MKKIAVFASGSGSNFQVIAEQFKVDFVFSDHKDAYVLERAKRLGVLTYAFELNEFDDKATYEAALVRLLDEHQIDLVCLAGYMKIVGATLLAAYEGRIVNIHPAYLPEFPGAHGIEEAWEAGVEQSGVTIHWVDSGVDTGQIIKQVRVPRFADDSINSFEKRIHETEYQLYPEVLQELGVEKKSLFYNDVRNSNR
ncbi:phosphoribosylglycinamide formyltransferase [Streptococcus castoreus]|uniref:phosphoribosylglycinamide formyltransferase n=1 Tax=Streptococcus castoreus TaxID=254786 RepID=UPI000421164A|nr:phosphoribosylglycinamide formyltransferase [Streptococcus castoreus]